MATRSHTKQRRVLAAAISLVGCLVCMALLSPKRGSAAVDRRAQVERSVVRKTVVLNGVVWPKNWTNVSPRIGGRVTAVLVEKGDYVRRGQVLVKLDERGARMELARRQFALERAEMPEATGSDPEHAARREFALAIERRQAQFELEIAKQTLQETSVRAPHDGRVVHLGVREGDAINPTSGGTPAIVIADTRQFVVEVEGDEHETAPVRAGQRVEVVIPAASATPLVGSVSQAPVLKRLGTGTIASPVFGFVVDVDAGAAELQLGYGARVEVAVAEHRDVPRVPIGALARKDGTDYVLAVAGTAALLRPVPVKVGLADDYVAEVSGVEPGTEVIVAASESILNDLVSSQRGPY